MGIPVVEIHREDEYPFRAYAYHNGKHKRKQDKKDREGQYKMLTDAYLAASDLAHMM